ncbi:MAG: sensor histidine kinase [Thermomicrobiales bacterium]
MGWRNGNAARIEQVLLNLITNAITYSPMGGAVDVRVWADTDTALASVRDQGVGIAPGELPHLFDRFYRAPRAGVMRSGGMGLGLYICREIVARHGGAIRVESAEGVGSTFTFSLPLAEKDEGKRTKD